MRGAIGDAWQAIRRTRGFDAPAGLTGARSADTLRRPMSAPSSITVRVPSPLRASAGGAAELALEAATVREALERLERDHPALHRCVCDETGAVRRHVNVFVGKANVRDGAGVDTPLAHGDVLTILPAVSGG